MNNTAAVTTIIVGIVGPFVTCLTFVLGKWHEKKIEVRRIKEQQYIDFLTTFAKTKCNEQDNTDKNNEELSVKIQTIFLVGSKDVQIKLQNFLNLFINIRNDECDKNKSQNELYGELIQSMKVDLYGRKWMITRKSYNSLDNIKFVIFSKEENASTVDKTQN